MKIIYIDMDGVIADFDDAVKSYSMLHTLDDYFIKNPDHIPGIFRDLPVVDGAITAIKYLIERRKYELFIATSAPWENPESATDKRYWIERYFPHYFTKKMFITHRKDLLIGDYLIDDRLKNGAENFKGEHIHFGSSKFPTWKEVLHYLL